MNRFQSFGAILALLAAMPGCGRADAADLMPRLQQLADGGSAEAVYHIGMAYQTGTGVAEDRAKALALFRKAAALGDPLGSYKLGCYYDGQGQGLVDADPDTALRYKLVAAQAGYALAQQDVASLYLRRGEPGPALEWLAKAAAQGWPEALMAYASVHNGTPGIQKDAALTAAYFRLFLDRTDARPKQREWLAKFEKGMTPDNRARAAGIVEDYRAMPTSLTIKALSGVRAAEALAAGS